MTIPGSDISTWHNPQNCGAKAIDAPAKAVGSKFFAGPFNVQVCSDYAVQQNSVNQKAGLPPPVKMVNAYYVNKDGIPYGTYCGLYSEDVDASYASYAGAQDQGHNYAVVQSWKYVLV